MYRDYVPHQLVGSSCDHRHHHCIVQVRGLQETRCKLTCFAVLKCSNKIVSGNKDGSAVRALQVLLNLCSLSSYPHLLLMHQSIPSLNALILDKFSQLVQSEIYGAQ